MKPQHPRILRSDLSRPPRWYVVTRYVEKDGVSGTTGKKMRYLVAREKFDVTDQMETIIANVVAGVKKRKQKPAASDAEAE